MRDGARRREIDAVPGETLLQSARRSGVPLDANCEQGHCGTCIVTLLRGTVTMHRNAALSPADLAEGLILACQAMPTSDEVEIEKL